VLIGIIGFWVYNSFFKIDLNQFHYDMCVMNSVSPDGMHQIELDIVGEVDELREEKGKIVGEKNDTYYEYARLWYDPTVDKNGCTNWTDKNSKIIYWQKNCTDNQVQWIDNEHVKINGVTLNIYKDTYDYRRSWK
jgi:hypothetical protein